MGRRRYTGVVGSLLAMLLVTCGSPPSGEAKTGGPSEPPPHGYVLRGVAVGSRFTDGWETLRFPNSGPVTIHAVESAGLKGLRQVGVLVAGDDRHDGSIQSDRHYPPKNPMFGTPREAIGVALPARPGRYPHWELLVGYEVTDAGVGQREGIVVTFTQDGKRQTWTSPARLTVCSEDLDDATCDSAAEAASSG